MLGFPGETDQQFQNTLEFMREVRFDSAFMFAYSPREGTKAAVMDNQIPHHIKIERLEQLIALQNEITLQINRSQLGLTFPVFVEGRSSKDSGKWTGLTPHGKTVNFPADRDLYGDVVTVRSVEAHLWGFIGDIEKVRSERGLVLQMAH
jgi:tRNA-2-methylthio-N6-dimethylallyladenosine synthase